MVISAEPVGQLYSTERSIHAVRSGDGWIFLDLAQDAYSCLYQLEPDHNGSENDTPAIPGRMLVDLGVPPHEREFLGATAFLPSNRRWRNLPGGTSLAPILLLFPFLLALIVAGWTFRGRSVHQLIRSVRMRSPPHRKSERHRDISAVVRAFDTLCLFLPFRHQCLFRCYFLLRVLERAGHSADWVFGVTLFPFEAHCWLAQGDLLIGEDAARAMQYEPILILPPVGR